MNASKHIDLSSKMPNTLKAGATSGFVFTWLVFCPNYLSFLTSINLEGSYLPPFLAGLFLTLAAMASPQIRRYFVLLPWHYFGLTAILLLFARLFTSDSLYFGISSFLLGICAFYLLNRLADLFIKHEDPVSLTGITLLVVILLTLSADIYLSFRPEHSGLTSFLLSFSIPAFFVTMKKQGGEELQPHEYADSFFRLPLNNQVWKHLLLLSFCFITVFVIYLLSSFYLHHFITMGYGCRLYAATYLLYAASLVLYIYVIRRYNPSYGLGYCICIFACAVALAAAAFDNVWIHYLFFFLYSVSAAGADLFTLLIIVFLARQTKRSLCIIVGVVIYWLIVEVSSLFSISAISLNDIRLISLFTILVILLSFPFLASRHMALPLRHAPGAAREEEQFLDEPTGAGIEMRMPPQLTAAEKKVYSLLCQGSSNMDIASALHISQNTVKFHVRNILQKAGVKNRFELVTAKKSAKYSPSP